MGAIYSALDQTTNQEVAVKFLLLSASKDWKTHELFARSSKVLASLKHPGLPQVYCVGESLDGSLYLVREAFSGGTLEERVTEQRLSPEAFTQLFIELLSVLQYLHSRVPSVLHRDIKPSNIMFRAKEDWRPVLVDFDVVAAPGPQEQRVTIVGTPGYTSPEQFAGQASTASDLYSLAATMLFVATTTHPDLLPRINGRFSVGPFLTGLPTSVRAVLLRLLEPSAQERFPDAQSALTALRTPTLSTPPHRVASSPLRYGLWLPLLIAPLLWILFKSPEKPPAPEKVTACQSPFVDCDGDPKNSCEANLSSDPNHCGICNTKCAPEERCLSGQCTASKPACAPPMADCDGRRGCEANLSSDTERCGDCDTECGAGEACKAGKCITTAKIKCEPSKADCDANAENGCEADLLADESNCGRCGAVCNDGEKCSANGCSNEEKLDDSYVSSLCADYLGCYKESGISGQISGRINLTLNGGGVISKASLSGSAPASIKGCVKKLLTDKKIENFSGAAGNGFFIYVGTYVGGTTLLSESWGFRREGDTRPIPEAP